MIFGHQLFDGLNGSGIYLNSFPWLFIFSQLLLLICVFAAFPPFGVDCVAKALNVSVECAFGPLLYMRIESNVLELELQYL